MELRPAGARTLLIDVSHPAHVHFFGSLARMASSRGDAVLFAGRGKDVTRELLESSGFPFVIVSEAARRRSRASDAVELAERVIRLRQLIYSMKPDVVLTRNPAGVIAGMWTRAWTIFDTDDGRAVGLHYRLGAPFADVVTSSVHDPERHGARHIRYRALKPHAFLHPEAPRTKPIDAPELGHGTTPLTVIRWSRHDASHDGRVRGLPPTYREKVRATLEEHGHVLFSSEGEKPRLLIQGHGEVQVAPSRFHELLAYASLCVTDGQAVSAEAAVLGVPTLRLSSFSGRVWYLNYLEDLGLVTNFRPGEEEELLVAIRSSLHDEGLRDRTHAAALELYCESEDLAGWWVRLIDGLPPQRRWRRLRTVPPVSTPRGSAH